MAFGESNTALFYFSRSTTSSTCCSDIEIDSKTPLWHHYVLCGVKGILEHAELPSSVGMSLMVDGQVPQGAGLSSSSALVCAAAIATMYANNVTIQKVCAHCIWKYKSFL